MRSPPVADPQLKTRIPYTQHKFLYTLEKSIMQLNRRQTLIAGLAAGVTTAIAPRSL
ncbi:hypothetical protein RMSM_03100, partial [Rhodopirellula maiorica SM1]